MKTRVIFVYLRLIMKKGIRKFQVFLQQEETKSHKNKLFATYDTHELLKAGNNSKEKLKHL